LFAGLLTLAACSSNNQPTETEATEQSAAATEQPAASSEPAAANTPAPTAPTDAEAVALTLDGGPFHQQRVVIAHPTDGATRPGAAIAFWAAQQGMGTQLDASHEKPTGMILRVPSAPANKPGTYPIEGGALLGNGEGGIDGLSITKGSVTITTYGNRVAGTFTGSGEYMDMKTMKQVPVTISNGSFDLQRGSDR